MFKIKLLLVVLLALVTLQSAAQICINKYAAIRYTGTTYDTLTHAIVTANNELISAGTLFDFNKAGHIAKYSEKGTPIWSYQYKLDYFDFVKLIFFNAPTVSDIISTADGGFYIAGTVSQTLGEFSPGKKWGLLAKLDKFGKVIWNKTVTKSGRMCFSNIYPTADGDIIAYLATDNGPKKHPGEHSYNNVLRIGPDGKIKWSILLFTYLFDAGGLGVDSKRAILQASNKNILIGDIVHLTNPVNSAIEEGNLHFFELDYETGKIKWETSYTYPAPAYDSAYVPDLVSVKELSNGKFSFITTLYLPQGNTNDLVKKGANIITSNKGVIEKVIAYTPADASTCSITGATIDKSNGNRTLLFNKGGKGILVNINDEGGVVWKQGYSNENGNFPTNCFAAGKQGYYIFNSNNRSKQYQLLITDATGANNCANETADIEAVPASLNYGQNKVVTDLTYNFTDPYYDYARPLKRIDEYPLIKNIDCQETLACCTDIIDSSSANTIAICEGKSYLLPDSTVVKEAGTYPITFKTALGCDSIVFYKITIDKDVAKLTLGDDTCLTGQRTITLTATEGFEKYYWMNEPVKQTNAFAITQPGKYFVRVKNKCGSKTDSLEIFSQCDYPIQMPTAFTPNADLINDNFRITSFNKNKLLNFRIYDRWGKMVFQTNNPSKGWDGTYRNEPQGAGTYVYYLEMMGYSGNRISHKGFVNLIR